MFNADTLMDDFIGLVGCDKDLLEGLVIGDMLVSSSGLKYGRHPLITHANLKSIVPKDSEYNIQEWEIGQEYSKDEMVIKDSIYYASIMTEVNSGNAPADPTKWRETNLYNEWLRVKIRNSINQALSDWYGKKVGFETAKSLLQRNWVLDPPGYNYTAYVPKQYVGFKIVPSPLIDVVVTINRASIQTLTTGAISLKLYRNGSSTAINTYAVSGVSGDIVTKDISINLERGNYYYLAFDTTGLSIVNSISQMDKSDWPTYLFPGTRPFVEVSAFEHDGPGHGDWKDIKQLSNFNNFGLNVSISAKCDMTQLLLDHKELFAPLIQARGEMDLLREMAYNPSARINRNEENVPRETILYELDGNKQMNNFSIQGKYEAILEDLTFDFREMSKYCLPERRNKIKTRAT